MTDMSTESDMHELRTRLQQADPLAHEPAPSSSDIDTMRRVVLAAMSTPPWWPRPALVAATIAVTLVASVALGRRLPATRPGAPNRGAAAGPAQGAPPATPTRRQLQFATPGGTRIIWVFNSDFTL